MTDIELLPLPEPYGYLRDLDGRLQMSIGPVRPADRAGGYATPWAAMYDPGRVRANVAHATAAKDAEIERLRAELDRVLGEHVRVRRELAASKSRAERLAEALRDVTAVAITTLHSTHPEDVTAEFTFEELGQISSMSEHLQAESVEGIYRRGWDVLQGVNKPTIGKESITMTDTKLYADRDISAFPKLYGDHVAAMTREGLHSKSDIAAELAYRDSRINALLNERLLRSLEKNHSAGLARALREAEGFLSTAVMPPGAHFKAKNEVLPVIRRALSKYDSLHELIAKQNARAEAI